MDTPRGKRPKYCYVHPGSPNWYYEIKIRGHRERGSTGFSDAESAAEFVQARRVALLAELDATIQKNTPLVAGLTGETFQKSGLVMTLEEALNRFHADQVVGTADERNALRRAVYMLDGIGNKNFHEVTHADLFNYRMNRLKELNRYGQPISPLTANREMAHIRQVFNHMNDLGVKMPDHWPNWSKLIDNEAETNAARTRHLSTEEEAALFKAIDTICPDLAGFIEFMLLSGQRKAAIVGLCRKDIDWQAMSFKVLLKGKGAKKREHVVALTNRMAEIIKEQPLVDGTDRVFTYVCDRSRLNPDGPGYIRKKGERYPLTIAGWNKRWKAVLKEAGLTDFRVHDLRHTAATRVVAASRNINLAKEVLGHRQISTTQRYVHADLEGQRGALQEAENMSIERQRQLRESIRPPLRVVGGGEA